MKNQSVSSDRVILPRFRDLEVWNISRHLLVDIFKRRGRGDGVFDGERQPMGLPLNEASANELECDSRELCYLAGDKDPGR